MKKIIHLSAIFFVLLQGLVSAQNITCESSAPICTGPTYTYPAGTSGYAEPGAYYGCLTTQPAPAWFHMLVENPGDITIYMYSTPLLDIDFICWGPFTDPHEPCVQGLSSDKVVDCSYSPNPSEYCDIPTGQTGEYYILLITNYSQQPAYITFSQTDGSGNLDCSIIVDPPVNCGDPITVDHIAGNVAPVTKTTTYGTVSNVPGEPSKCWMTSNLGADHQASDAHDTTEASSGWYWQFNRMQGFMHDGTTRTPDTEWISYINEDSDWLPANDPCNLEIGDGWRIPTQSEWVNVNDAGGWTTWIEPWESLLKLHSGGYLDETDGSLHMRGEGGAFWSNLQGSFTTAWYERFNDTLCGYAGHFKTRGYSLRCVKDEPVVLAPEICLVSVTPDNYNKVIWEKQSSGQISHYNIYRETTQINVYEVVGSVAYADSSVFTDSGSNAQQQSYKYKLSAVTNTGAETSLSNYHKTMHLIINEGPTVWNLIWSPYEGFPIGTYYIYRGTDPNSLELFDSISSSFTSYSDINPPFGPLYYAIEIIHEEGCFPGRDNEYGRSRSNVQFNGVVGLEDNTERLVNIYPNPARDVLNIQLAGNKAEALLTIYNAQGKNMVSRQIQQENTAISIGDLNSGVYIIRLEYGQNVLIRKLVVY